MQPAAHARWDRWAVVVVVVGGVALYLALTGGTAPRRITAILPAARDQAVVVATFEHRDARGWEVAQLRADGGVPWRAPTGRLLMDDLGIPAVVVADVTYALEYVEDPDPRGTQLVARRGGEVLWRVAVDLFPAGTPVPIGDGSLLLDAERVYVARMVDAEGSVDAFSRRDGVHVWGPSPLGELSHRMSPLGDDHLLARSLNRTGTALIERGTGAISPAGWSVPAGEVDGASMVVIGGEATLFAPSGRRVRMQLPEGVSAEVGGPLGLRRDRVVFGVRYTDGTIGLAACDRASGENAWVSRLTRGVFVDFFSDGHELPRLLAVAFHNDFGEDLDEHRLAVVDLDGGDAGPAGVVVARYTRRSAPIAAIAARGRAYAWLAVGPLVALDPDRGAIAAATRFSDVPVQPPGLRAIEHGQLWVTGESPAPADALPFAVVDLATGRVTHTHGAMTATDVTPSIGADLEAVDAFDSPE